MKLGSLFDGAGTCPLAGSVCGVKPVWASEIEPFPVSVSSSNFPQMDHLGDITQVHGDKIEAVDIITFGSPCQDLSVAGPRKGLDGERSGLFMEAVRIIKEMRCTTHGRYPEIVIWENVPGAFSSNKGEDFRTVLEELCRICNPEVNVPRPPLRGGRANGEQAEKSWEMGSLCPGVPWMQNSGESPSVAAASSLSSILEDSVPEKYFLSEKACKGILRRSEERGKPLPELLKAVLEKQAGLSPTPSKSDVVVTGGGKGALIQTDQSATLATNNDQCLFQPRSSLPAYGFKAGQSQAHGIGWERNVATTLGARMSGTEPTICAQKPNPPTYVIAGNLIDRSPSMNGTGITEDVAFTLTTIDRHGVVSPLKTTHKTAESS